MAIVGKPYRVNYIAKSFMPGLTDVRAVVYKPNGSKLGIYTLLEVNAGDGAGIYYFDFEDSDIEGTYLFVVNCPSNPKKDAKQVLFEKYDDLVNEIEDAVKTVVRGGPVAEFD